MMGITTHIRTAVRNDMPWILQLAEKEYNQFQQRTPFNLPMVANYFEYALASPESLLMVITNSNQKPFGYLEASIEFLDLSTAPTAQCGHWFVDNPKQMYGNKNYGLDLLGAFEGWAKHKNCDNTIINIRMDPGTRRSYDRVFDKMGYRANYVAYSKDMPNE